MKTDLKHISTGRNDEDKVVMDFLAKHSPKIADDGFTKTVMERIPHRNVDWDNVLHIVCAVVIVGALIWFFGAGLLHELAHFRGTLLDLVATILEHGVCYVLMSAIAIIGICYHLISEKYQID